MAREERADELSWLPATTLAGMIRRKKVSPVEVVNAILARIEALNPVLNAFVTLTGDQARRAGLAAPGWARCTGCRSR